VTSRSHVAADAPRGDAGRGRGSAVERRLVPIRFAFTRLRAHASRTVLVAAGVAVAAAMLAMAAVAAVAVQDRAVQRALAELQPTDRAVQVDWSGVPAQSNLSLAQLDRVARAALRPVLSRPPFGVLVFRQATWGGAFVNLGAVDGLSRWLVLRSGRLPRPCTAGDCELVQIGGEPVAPKLPYLHVVGRATIRAGAPLAAYFAAAGQNRPPILLADGVRGFSELPLPDAAVIARTAGWIVPVAPGAIHEWEIPGFQRRLDLAQNRLESADPLFSLAAPTDTLREIRATTRVAGRRLLIVGGDAAILLLGFAVLASTRLRRDQQAVRRRLRWFGAQRSQVTLVAATEVLAITLVATIAGWLLGTGAGALLARHLGAPGAAAVAHSVVTARGLLIAVGLAVIVAVVMLVAVRAEPVSFGGLRITIADVAALGALAAILLALARGKADAGSLAAGGGTGIVLLVLPGLLIFVLAVVAARLLAPALRLLERSGRRTGLGVPVSARIALLSLARAPGQVILSVVFFVVAVSVAVFAIGYRGTLETGMREQARYAVPADVVLQEDLQRLVPIQQAASPAQYARLGTATPVLRDAGYVTGNSGRDFTLLALPADALTSIQGWRGDFSSESRTTLARRLRPPGPAALRGLTLPAGATALQAPVTVRGDRVGLALTVLNRRGDFSTVGLGEHGPGAHLLGTRIPPAARGGRIVALRVTFPLIAAFVAGHRESGTALSVSDASRGLLELGRMRAGGAPLAGYRGWIGTKGIAVTPAGAGVTLHYVVNRAADSVFRPRQPLEGQAVPVLASPAVAAAAGAGGILPLHVEDQTIPAQVVGVVRNMPSVDGDVVVADRSWWFAAANAASPGSAVPGEVWLDGLRPGAFRRLASAPFDALDVTSQRAVYARLRTDPLALGTLDLLTAAAVVGLVLAAIGVVLGVVGDMRDESGELFDLEAQGAGPADIRRHLLLRAAVVSAVGVAGGLVAGLIAGALVVAVVTVTAGAGTPLPPLARVTDWPVVIAALAVVGAGAALAAFAATRTAYARIGRWRFSEGLE
jgi:hypothetical protein